MSTYYVLICVPGLGIHQCLPLKIFFLNPCLVSCFILAPHSHLYNGDNARTYLTVWRRLNCVPLYVSGQLSACHAVRAVY